MYSLLYTFNRYLNEYTSLTASDTITLKKTIEKIMTTPKRIKFVIINHIVTKNVFFTVYSQQMQLRSQRI